MKNSSKKIFFKEILLQINKKRVFLLQNYLQTIAKNNKIKIKNLIP